MTYTPEEEKAIQFADSVKWKYRRRHLWKVAAAVSVVLLIGGIAVGLWLTQVLRGSPTVTETPDHRFAFIACDQVMLQNIPVPTKGLIMPRGCYVVVSVRTGGLRVFPKDTTFPPYEIAQGYRSQVTQIDRIYPLDWFTYVDVAADPTGQKRGR